jgi:hypothetical protein
MYQPTLRSKIARLQAEIENLKLMHALVQDDYLFYKSMFEVARREINLRSVDEGTRIARALSESGYYKRFTDPVIREEGLKKMREMMVWNPPEVTPSDT